MTTPRLEVGVPDSIVTSLLFAPDDWTMIGELSWISRSDLFLHLTTTWMLVPPSVPWFLVLPEDSAGCSVVGVETCETALAMTERALGAAVEGGGIGGFLALEEAGRRAAMVDDDDGLMNGCDQQDLAFCAPRT